jgi:outer membrane protein
LFARSDTSIYIDGENETKIFPFVRSEWGAFFIRGPSFGVHLYEDNNWTIDTSVNIDYFGDIDRGDNIQLADMVSLDNAWMASVDIFYKENWGEVSISLASDLSDTHDGNTANLSYSYSFRVGNWMIKPSIGAEWFSDAVSQYYYGITEADVNSTRPFYQPASGINYEANINSLYSG